MQVLEETAKRAAGSAVADVAGRYHTFVALLSLARASNVPTAAFDCSAPRFVAPCAQQSLSGALHGAIFAD
jgi:polysaccharide pyruvyl transferase WcaK-like protein